MDEISVLAGVALSLVFSYVPGARAWFDTLIPDYKRLVMLAACAIVPVAMAILSCAGMGADFGIAVTCDRVGIVALVRSFVVALVANQTTYQLSPAIPQKTYGEIK